MNIDHIKKKLDLNISKVLTKVEGGNSTILKVETSTGSFVAIKLYKGLPDRINRMLNRELSAIRFLKTHNFRNIPEILEVQNDLGLIIFKWIDGEIPKDYYLQMQMQLQVTGLMHCDYIEAVFASKYNNNIIKEGPSQYNGYVAIIRYAEMKGNQEFYYIYSPINVSDWIPDIQEGEEIVEITPWRLMQWSEQLVIRNEGWWQSFQPIMNTFWEDVAKAKEGNFAIPESKRMPKKQKIEKCLIQFHKLDENGNNIQI